MLTSSPIPSDNPIRDVSFVRHDGTAMVVVADRWNGLWTWTPSTDTWDGTDLAFAHAADPVMEPYPDATNGFDMIAASSVGGRFLMAGGGDEQEPALWDMATGAVIAAAPVTGAYLTDVIAFGGGFLTAEQYSEEVRFWSPEVHGRVLGEVGSLFCLASARYKGRDIILAGGESLVVMSDTGEELAYFTPYEGRVWGVTAAEVDGRRLAVGVTEEGRMSVWDIDDGGEEEVYEPVEASQRALEDVEVMDVGRRPLAVTAADDGGLRLWNLADGTEAGNVAGHRVSVMETAVDDGRTILVTGGDDGTVRLWEAADLAQ